MRTTRGGSLPEFSAWKVESSAVLTQAERDSHSVSRPQSKYDVANDGYIAEQKAQQAMLTKQTVRVCTCVHMCACV